jgi:Kef-type K+ transport system membrane component KefB
VTYESFAIVAAIALSAPLLRALVPALRVPAIVLELVLGIAVGPHGLEWVHIDAPIQVFTDIGLALLLFLAGMEIDLERLRGRVLRLSAIGFAISFVLGLGVGELTSAAGLDESPLLIAIILVATSLSVIIVPLKDANETGSDFGQLVIAAASLAEFGALVLLAFFFSGKREGLETEALHLGLFAALALVLAGTVAHRRAADAGSKGVARRLSAAVDVLERTTAQIRVRADFALVAAAVWLASLLGLEAILAAFTAGVIRGLMKDEPGARAKSQLEAASFGIFIPFFFISSGLNFDLDALFASASTALRVPVFLVAILFVRSLPALLYRRLMGGRPMLAAGLLQATSLTFVVVAAHIGMRLDLMSEATGAALIGAGLVSVMIFPGAALALLRASRRGPEPEPSPAA